MSALVWPGAWPGPGLLWRTACEVCAGSALFFTLLLLLGLRRLDRRPAAPSPAEWPAVVLLRPCEGAEPGLYENLLSSATAPYPGPRRVLLLVPSRSDAAYEIAVAVAGAARSVGAPGCAVEVLVSRPRREDNRKVAQLAAGLAASTEPVVIGIDSDVRLNERDLPALVSTLCAPTPDGGRVGAAFSSPVEVAPRTLWDRASAALVGGSPQNFRVLFGLNRLLGGVTILAGALCALRRDALVEIGGFDGVRSYLGEDYELSRRLRERGYSVELSPEPARCTDGGRSAREVLLRVVRWLTVVRAQRPLLLLTVPPFVSPTPLLLGMALLYRSTFLLLCVPLLLLARVVLARRLRRAHGQRVSWLGAAAGVLAAETLLGLGFVGAFLGRRVRWRGHSFHVGAGGRLRYEGGPPEASARTEQRGAERDGLLGRDPAQGPLHQRLGEQPADQR